MEEVYHTDFEIGRQELYHMNSIVMESLFLAREDLCQKVQKVKGSNIGPNWNANQ